MSRCGNSWDNAVAESFCSSLKKERIRKRIFKTQDLAWQISPITLKCSITGPGATVTLAASVQITQRLVLPIALISILKRPSNDSLIIMIIAYF